MAFWAGACHKGKINQLVLEEKSFFFIKPNEQKSVKEYRLCCVNVATF